MNLNDAIPTIASKAMKVKLTRGTGYARIRDAAAEQAVKAQFGDQGQLVTKALFKSKTNPVYKRAQLASEMYQYHVKNTLPHSDDGWRVLPNALYLEYSQTMANYASQLKQMDQHIVANYSQLVQDDINERNATLVAQGKASSAIISDYPTADHMQRLLYVRYYFEPINTSGDFRYSMSDDDKSRLDELVHQIEANAKADLFTRMLEPMQRFIEKLSVPIGTEGSVFRDSLIENLNELVVHLPKLNIDGDPHITQMLTDIEAVIKPYVFNPSVLREVPEVRQSARDKMAELVKKFDDYGFGG